MLVFRPTEQPEFCLGIAHDYGPLWDIHWCPSGAWNGKTPMASSLVKFVMFTVVFYILLGLAGEKALIVIDVPKER